jgi:peptidoglycan/LPS O-acetylase OafA/YrhL
MIEGRWTRHHALDLLRGFAAIGIATYHFFALNRGIELQSLGTFGVYFFFVLSGLTMMIVYGRTFFHSVNLGDATLFYWNRISRILPLLCAIALVNFLIGAISSLGNLNLVAGQAASAFMTGSGLFALHLPGYLSNSTGAWSLGIEIVFYLMFPVVCLVSNAATTRALAVAALFLILGQQIVLLFLHKLAIHDLPRFWHYYTTPLTFAPFFLFGISIYRFTGGNTRLNLLWSFSAMAIITAYSSVLHVDVFSSNTHYLALAGLTFVAVFFAYRSNLPAFLIKPASFLGNISYALYLTHPLALDVANSVSAAMQFGPVLNGIIYFGLSVAAAYGSFVLFERPVRNALRRIYDFRNRQST